jgi:hypothetical protein
MSTTFKSAFRYQSRVNSPLREHVNIDEEFCNAELASIKREKEMVSIKVNCNGARSQRVICGCAETLMSDGTRIALHTKSDCEYTAARSALVPDVFDAAVRMPGKFMKNFCAEMERRSKPLLNGATSLHVDEATRDPIGTATPTEAGWNWSAICR